MLKGIFLLNEYRSVKSRIKKSKWNKRQYDSENNQQRKS
jgi:hypothetical protein